ncbi:hypothetical protein VNO78_25590 [Psophocarpus tetragonolobus]|uniref:Uncharacterized protein n=1 Tax=Psophocarpus tetragonolobus TaxID=3891 RepID=A0AAN9SAD9_PSOTE
MVSFQTNMEQPEGLTNKGEETETRLIEEAVVQVNQCVCWLKEQDGDLSGRSSVGSQEGHNEWLLNLEEEEGENARRSHVTQLERHDKVTRSSCKLGEGYAIFDPFTSSTLICFPDAKNQLECVHIEVTVKDLNGSNPSFATGGDKALFEQ